MIPTLYPGQFCAVTWCSLEHIWKPRELDNWQRMRMQLYRRRANKADELLQRMQQQKGNPFA